MMKNKFTLMVTPSCDTLAGSAECPLHNNMHIWRDRFGRIASLQITLFNVKQHMMFCRSGASRDCQSSRLAPLLQSFIIRGGHMPMSVSKAKRRALRLDMHSSSDGQMHKFRFTDPGGILNGTECVL